MPVEQQNDDVTDYSHAQNSLDGKQLSGSWCVIASLSSVVLNFWLLFSSDS